MTTRDPDATEFGLDRDRSLSTDPDVDPAAYDADADPWAGEADALPADAEVDALVIDIATTRSEMARTVDELGDRLSPSAVADRAGDAVRQATVGKLETKVNDMSTTASDLASNAAQTAHETGSGIIETIRTNPVPAILIGIGAGWLWMSRDSGRSRSSRSRWTDDGTTDGGWDASMQRGLGPSGSSGSIGDRARDASEALTDAASDARRSASGTLNELGASTSRTADELGTRAGEVGAQVQQAVQSNPLAFGAMAVAVGTAVGLALPATQAEKRVMGTTGSRLIDQVETAVSEPLDRMSDD